MGCGGRVWMRCVLKKGRDMRVGKMMRVGGGRRGREGDERGNNE